MFGEVDNCTGVSANVLFGQEANIGTGCCDILFNEAQFFAQNKYEMKDDIIEEDACNNLMEFMENFDAFDTTDTLNKLHSPEIVYKDI